MHRGYMTQRNKNMIRDAGLDPADWIVRHEDDRYLHLTDFGGHGKVMIIDKASSTEVKRPRAIAVAARR